jgi:HSP20 family protein
MAEEQKGSSVEPKQPSAPLGPFGDLRAQMDRLFDDFIHTWRPTSFGGAFGSMPPAEGKMAPRMDVKESDEAVEISAELPGIDEKDIEVTLQDGVLSIKGEKREEREEKEKNYVLSERHYGSYQRSLRLPDSVDEEKVSAKFEGGVLQVNVGKKPDGGKPEAKRIPIGG